MALRRAQMMAAAPPATAEVFDAPVIAGREVTAEPLTARRRQLAALDLPSGYRRILVHDDDKSLFAAVRDAGLEGVVAKRGASSYKAGARSRDWV